MKICIYSPYFPKHVGGGEKYLLDTALVLQKNHQVSIALSSPTEISKKDIQIYKKKYEDFIGSSLDSIKFISSPLGTTESTLKKIIWTKQFDCMYYATDGSVFFSLAKKNILHIQIPFTDTKKTFSKIKLKNWHVKNTNSFFTKNVIEKHWQTTIDVVHHPMIANDMFLENEDALQNKEKIILNVGRFFRQLHSKRQDVLVQTFKEFHNTYPKKLGQWKLVLIGSVEDTSYLNEVKALAKGLNVTILNNVSREELIEWYQKASIYWHATGYSVDQVKHPEKVEHFGISTVEAMAAGCAPVVINKGGQPEILGDELKSLLWNTTTECITNTSNLITSKELLLQSQKTAMQRAQKFTEPVFEKKLNIMLEK